MKRSNAFVLRFNGLIVCVTLKLSCLLQPSSIDTVSVIRPVFGVISNTKRSLANQNICYGCNTSASVGVGRSEVFRLFYSKTNIDSYLV